MVTCMGLCKEQMGSFTCNTPRGNAPAPSAATHSSQGCSAPCLCTAGYSNTSRCDLPVKVQDHDADVSKQTKPSSASLGLGLPCLRRFSQVYDGIQQTGLQDSPLRLLRAVRVCGRQKGKRERKQPFLHTTSAQRT